MKAIEEQIFERANRPVKKINKKNIETQKVKYDLSMIGDEDE